MDSDDLPVEKDTNSKTNLIDVQHVGVTAKLRTPLKRAVPECSSTETDGMGDLFKSNSRKQYSKLVGEESESPALTTPPLSATSTTEESKLLYEMHADGQRTCCSDVRRGRMRNQNVISRIEFQLHKKSSKRLRHCRCQRTRAVRKRNAALRRKRVPKKPPFLQRLRTSLKELCTSEAPIAATTTTTNSHTGATPQYSKQSNSMPRTYDGVYAFEHGCSDFLHVTDSPPLVLSNLLAERATFLATRFWAEFFGGLHIGVSFVVTFLLQTYRFLLYALINTLLVGLLQMTSDYLLKPLLTVAFNGFLQPPLIFVFNILTSLRDMLEPIAETINNFMKPVATVGRSFRLVNATYNKKKFVKDV